MLQPRELPLSHGATYGREREMHEEDRVICEEPWDRAGLAKACGNLGNCMCSTGEYMKAISYLKMEYGVAKELEREKERASAAMNIGAAMRLHIRSDRQAAAASPALSPQMAPLCPDLVPSQGAAPRHQTIGARGVGGGGWCMCSPALRPIRSPELSGANALARLRWRVRGRAGHRVSRQTSRRGSASAHLEDGVKEAATWLKLPLLLGAAAGLCWLTCTWRTLI